MLVTVEELNGTTVVMTDVTLVAQLFAPAPQLDTVCTFVVYAVMVDTRVVIEVCVCTSGLVVESVGVVTAEDPEYTEEAVLTRIVVSAGFVGDVAIRVEPVAVDPACVVEMRYDVSPLDDIIFIDDGCGITAVVVESRTLDEITSDGPTADVEDIAADDDGLVEPLVVEERDGTDVRDLECPAVWLGRLEAEIVDDDVIVTVSMLEDDARCAERLFVDSCETGVSAAEMIEDTVVPILKGESELGDTMFDPDDSVTKLFDAEGVAEAEAKGNVPVGELV